jgi:glutaconyl-CoA/methylmalonyl-CoA decarboxylase subunit gamma
MKKTLTITVNGKTYDVVAEIHDDEVSPLPSLPTSNGLPTAAVAAAPVRAAAPARTTVVAAAGEVHSPLAGKVSVIDAPVGTAVKSGDTVITLEAMKMNTMIPAPCDGTVASVSVAVGDSIEEGQLLLTLK